ncbi:hypothetical protein EJ05DRAFT_496358 [Pseudovirgaria hyperparasitica]|uniref:Uncharacterized protein n=1 Tax=Pseudovirgaria hyperparasitica TaxID=470096 RepID=A0A6A6WMU2_9PEZI|nr:uncharacterized protein EJ05DRAFT_496358 [Pseudovirgaria hyperparasitica]KAF2763541.1 hypothetical protein EJ05DRAFT_496358 [Pseudovirgaria hyperparasitica]
MAELAEDLLAIDPMSPETRAAFMRVYNADPDEDEDAVDSVRGIMGEIASMTHEPRWRLADIHIYCDGDRRWTLAHDRTEFPRHKLQEWFPNGPDPEDVELSTGAYGWSNIIRKQTVDALLNADNYAHFGMLALLDSLNYKLHPNPTQAAAGVLVPKRSRW